MCISDFALRGRQLFGMIVPGVVFAAGVCLLSRKDPVALIENGNPVVRSLAFVLAGYVVWAPIQNAIMIVLLGLLPRSRAYKALIGADAVLARTGPILHVGTLSEARRLEVCKWYVRHYSPALARVADEMEADINMLVGMPLALLVLLVGAISALVNSPSAVVALGAAVFAAGALIGVFVCFNRLAVEERRAWCEMVLVLAKSEVPRGDQTHP